MLADYETHLMMREIEQELLATRARRMLQIGYEPEPVGAGLSKLLKGIASQLRRSPAPAPAAPAPEPPVLRESPHRPAPHPMTRPRRIRA